jgi:hypothetical protein
LTLELLRDAGASFAARFWKEPITSFWEQRKWDNVLISEFIPVRFAAIDAAPQRWVLISAPLDDF